MAAVLGCVDRGAFFLFDDQKNAPPVLIPLEYRPKSRCTAGIHRAGFPGINSSEIRLQCNTTHG
jgi:hypothetical protein